MKANYIQAITETFPELPADKIDAVAGFAVFLHEENKVQNLTRLDSPKDFVDLNLRDCIELIKVLDIQHVNDTDTIADLGSGCGIPGIICAILNPKQKWLLIEAEKSKADFLKRATEMFHVEHCRVIHARIESALSELKPEESPKYLVARALGKIEKIYSWVEKCSTWNKIILLKSRGWEEEWAMARRTKSGRNLTTSLNHDYSDNNRDRRIVVVTRKKLN